MWLDEFGFGRWAVSQRDWGESVWMVELLGTILEYSVDGWVWY